MKLVNFQGDLTDTSAKIKPLDLMQMDRESTLADFKSGVCTILVATSVAARGLDVKDLNLVINYDVPNHLEEYVHRAGRTGRAGNKGTAITFISEEEETYAPDLVKALKDSKAVVPTDLQVLHPVNKSSIELFHWKKTYIST